MDFAALAHAKPAIGRIEVQLGGGWLPAGTGFVVGNNLVVTALHVVADRTAPTIVARGPLRIVLRSKAGAQQRAVGLRIGDSRDPDDDWALLTTEEPTEVGLQVSAELPREKTGWWTFGFPRLNDEEGVCATAELRDPHAVYDRGTAVSLVSDDLKGSDVHGLSGSPLFFGDVVVGIFRSNLEEARRSFGFLYATPIASVLRRVDLARARPNPFQGMRPFEEDQAPFFFGRQDEATALLERLRRERMAILIGGSGSGKSSLLRAGLLPFVRSGALDPGSAVEPILLRPRNRALRELALALAERLTFPGRPDSLESLEARLASPGAIVGLVDQELHFRHGGDVTRGGVLFIVDQLEELYAADADQAAARLLLRGLSLAARAPGARIWWVGALRDGFMTELLRPDEDVELLRRSLLPLGPVNTKERLLEVIVAPASKAGLRFSPADFPERIASQAANEPGSLPLLQYALDRLWQQRDGDQLLERVYLAFGGIDQVVASEAEGVFARLDDLQKELTRRVFLRLVWIRTDGPNTRRLLEYGALEVLPAPTRDLAFHFVAARLLVATRAGLEIAHEALLRRWTRLADWLKSAPEAERQLQQLEAARRAWSERGEQAEDLLPPNRLRALGDWALADPAAIPGEERRFLIESLLRSDMRPEEWGRHLDPSDLELAMQRQGRLPGEMLLLARAGGGDSRQLAALVEQEGTTPTGIAAASYGVQSRGPQFLVDLAERDPSIRDVVSELLNDPDAQGSLGPALPRTWRRQVAWGAAIRLVWRERATLLLAAAAVFVAVQVVARVWWVVDVVANLNGIKLLNRYGVLGGLNLSFASAAAVYLDRRSAILRRPLSGRSALSALAGIVAVLSGPIWLANLTWCLLGQQSLGYFLRSSSGLPAELAALGILLPLLRPRSAAAPRDSWLRVLAACGVSIAATVLPRMPVSPQQLPEIAINYVQEVIFSFVAIAAVRWADSASDYRAVGWAVSGRWTRSFLRWAVIVLVLTSLALVVGKAMGLGSP